ncbi:MAG: hypothetical protein LC789_07720 [Actinobacteria bacterium]|nr:hypothetical protein [Actinomycetota bacterium]
MPLAHSFGERYDLPIPLVLFVLGGALVVVFSFLLVLGRPSGPTDRTPDEPVLRPVPAVLGWLSVAVTALLAYVGFTGTQEVSENLLPTVFWLLAWIAVPLSCGLLGDWTRPVNPYAFLSQLGDSAGARRTLLARRDPLRWPAGWWPAVVLFFVLACGELIVNLTATLPRVVATGLVVYALVCLTGGLLFGPSWARRGEVLGVLYATWGRLGWFRFGQPGSRGFAGGLRAPFAADAGRAAFVLLLLIAVNVDGLQATPFWADVERPQAGHLELFRLVTFLALAVLLAAVFTGFAAASARAGRLRLRPLPALAGLLPSMVPIAYAYLLAHNLQYLLVNAQLLPPLLGDPTGKHSLGLPYPFNEDFSPVPGFWPSAVYWYVGVAAIVGAHVLAVVLAHRHLHARADGERAAVRSEYPWLVAMVAYTMLSLVLIAQPLVTNDAPVAAGVVSQSSNTD